ncbi:MAG: RNA polymerase sigma factor [Patescibacteria group bacterium]
MKTEMTKQEQKHFVERIMKRDEAAFLEFVRAHEGTLYNYVYRQLRDKEKSEEIVQDAFVDFLEALRSFQFQSSLKTYLFSIAKYKVIDVMRKKKIKRVIFSALPPHIVESLAPVVIDDEIEQKELSSKIQKVLSMLPHDYQQILRLKYLDGVRVKEIADQLALPFKATESLLFRARKAFVKVFHQM